MHALLLLPLLIPVLAIGQTVNPKPTPQQLAWQDDEVGLFIHFQMFTYEPNAMATLPPPDTFKPVKLDTDQWMQAAKAIGAKYAVLTAKHGEGFCLWPTDAYPYSVKQSKWRGGKGDVVGDFVRSCHKFGIKPGIYYSTDSNAFLRAGPGGKVKSADPTEQAKYACICEQQLTELWTRYGKLAEIWFDGGSLPVEQGGPDVGPLLRKYQPDAMVFQSKYATIRWVGNEDGVAPYPCWATAAAPEPVGGGDPEGEYWRPGECDVPLRGGEWGWKPNQEHLIRPLDNLMELYLKSVGRNCNLLLNSTPNRDGLIPEADMSRYREFGAEITRRFGKSVAQASGAEVTLKKPAIINAVVSMEQIAEGERVREYAIEGLADGSWRELCRGTCVGHKRIDTFAPVEVDAVRFRALKSDGTPLIRRLAVYDTRKPLAKPTPEQVAWQDMEIEMFACLDPCTWQDTEYDNHTTPLGAISPAKLDTEQWAHVAVSMGAKQILFVAKHVGGFCWWQTGTSKYGVKETPWRGGKGDVVADLAKSCKKNGLKLAIYLSPADDQFKAGVGGKCAMPEAQSAYDKVYRQQLTELLTRYGPISEVWFDGSSVIEVGDILKLYAPHAMVLQGPHATLRWVGNEDGYAPYPNWNSCLAADAHSGVATSAHGRPDGDVWIPNEVDTVNVTPHTWFWKSKGRRLLTTDELMNVYYQSVGHGAVLLPNMTPDTSGLVPDEDARQAADLGAEVKRRFGKPLAETKGALLELAKPALIDHVVTMEDIRQGERIHSYVIEGLVDGAWKELCRGSSIGHKKIDRFAPVTVSKVRLRVTESAAPPVIRRLAVYHVGTAH